MNNEHKYLQWFSSQTKSIYWHDSAVRAESRLLLPTAPPA